MKHIRFLDQRFPERGLKHLDYSDGNVTPERKLNSWDRQALRRCLVDLAGTVTHYGRPERTDDITENCALNTVIYLDRTVRIPRSLRKFDKG